MALLPNYVPEVMATRPEHGATAVTVGATIQVLWNTDIDSETLAGRFQIGPVGGLPLSLATWQYSNRLLEFRADGMEPTTEYVVLIQRGVRSAVGPMMDTNYLFSFVTGTLGTIGAPTLIWPAHHARLDELPTFEWGAVSGATGYEIEVSNYSHYHPIAWESLVEASILTIQPDELLATDQSYYWRVRAWGQRGAGPWSESYSFYLASPTVPEAYRPSLYELPQGFYLSYVEPLDGTKTAWITLLTLIFNTTISSVTGLLSDDLFSVWELDLFGDPSRPEQRWPGTTYVSGNALIFSPETTILGYNTIYEWRVSPFLEAASGLRLGQPQSGVIIGPITPLLATPRQVRMEYGPLYLDQVPDCMLWEAIARASLFGKLMSVPADLIERMTISDLRSLPFEATQTLHEYVKARVAYQIGQFKLSDVAVQAGRNVRLGDFSYQLDLDAYEALDRFLRRLREELDELEDLLTGWSGVDWAMLGSQFDKASFYDVLYEPRDHLGPSVYDNTGLNLGWDLYSRIWGWPFLTSSTEGPTGTDDYPPAGDFWHIIWQDTGGTSWLGGPGPNSQ